MITNWPMQPAKKYNRTLIYKRLFLLLSFWIRCSKTIIIFPHNKKSPRKGFYYSIKNEFLKRHSRTGDNGNHYNQSIYGQHNNSKYADKAEA